MFFCMGENTNFLKGYFVFILLEGCTLEGGDFLFVIFLKKTLHLYKLSW
jgi:hypothetical protein